MSENWKIYRFWLYSVVTRRGISVVTWNSYELPHKLVFMEITNKKLRIRINDRSKPKKTRYPRKMAYSLWPNIYEQKSWQWVDKYNIIVQ